MIYISELANRKLIDELEKEDDLTLVKPTSFVDDRISTHADIYYCRLKDTVIKAEPDELGREYPYDCAFNAAFTGRYLIANSKYLNPRIKSACISQDIEILDVKQGYARCSILPVDETSVISADMGIYNSLKDKLDVLLISPGHIMLSGFDSGFIGGTGGRVRDTVYFNGSLSSHPDGEIIRRYISERGLKVKDFDYPLEDIGSII